MKKYALTLCSLLLLFGSTYANNDEKLAEFNNKLNANTISFQENKGQVYDQNYHSRPDVLFSGQSQGLVYHLKNNGISYQLSRIDSYKEVEDERTKEKRKEIDQSTIYRIDVNWLNANTAAPVIKGEALQGYNNYYLASCPDGALNVKSYQNITYQNIYDGIDLKWYSKAGELKYDYLVAPGADYTNIKLEIKGAERIFINKKGELEIKTPLGTLIEKAPYVEQEGRELQSAWKIQNGNTIGFEIENSNPKLPLLIDPAVRIWGTYYGGTGVDYGYSCVVDTSGNVYLAGQLNSITGIATSGSHQITYGGGSWDAFLVQFNSAGVRLWGTYCGGTGDDQGFSCAVDASGKVYLAGITTSTTGIANIGSYQSTYGGGVSDAFLVQFNLAGVRQWGTYYGGTDDDQGLFCAVDTSGKVYLTGYTQSFTGIATSGSHQPTYGGGLYDAFLVQFNSVGARQWGTYYGGTSDDYGRSCTVDALGKVYMAGYTKSITGVSTVGIHQSTFGGGLYDAYLVQFNSIGVRQWGTYYGGTGDDQGRSCVVDSSGKVCLVGYTDSNTGTDIATVGSHQSTYGGGIRDVFLVQFNSLGVRQWGTYYGGTGDDTGGSKAVDASGNVYLVGSTSSTTGISTIGVHQSTYGGGSRDAFFVQFNSTGVRQWGTYYGGLNYDFGVSNTVDASGKMYFTGGTQSSTGIATSGIHQSTFGGNYDAFLVQFECVAATSTDVQTSCNSITWLDGNTYTSSTNTPTFTIPGGEFFGCDSVVTLNFNYNPLTSTDVQTACNSFTWINGNTYTSSINTPTFTIPGGAASGCDSVVTLNLTITTIDNTTSINNDTISANQTGALYRWLNCDSSNAVIAGATNQIFIPTTTGNYAVEITAGACVDTSACVNIIITAIEELTNAGIKIYPNPIDDKIVIELSNTSSTKKVSIVSIEGKLVYSNAAINSNQLTIDAAAWSKGVYVVNIITDEGKYNLQLIKQ